MTKKGEAIVRRFETERFARRDRIRARMAQLTIKQKCDLLIKAGVLTKKGKLAAIYRPSPAAVR